MSIPEQDECVSLLISRARKETQYNVVVSSFSIRSAWKMIVRNKKYHIGKLIESLNKFIFHAKVPTWIDRG